MTLRVTLSIVPFGDETKERVIETLNISNTTFEEGRGPNGEDIYRVEHNKYKAGRDRSPCVAHFRSDGAFKLAELAIQRTRQELGE